jgi:probable F420-dependent oxidoreductase
MIGDADPSLLIKFAVRAEELGFHGLWTIDNAAGGPTATRPVLDAVHALTYVAGVTTTVRLGTAVLVLPRRNPVLLAKELATVDQLSGGRVIAGVGRGRDDESVGALGFPTDRPFARFAEGVAVMRAAWSRPSTAHLGEVWSFSGFEVEPKPAQRPGPPVWFGAAGPKSLERTAKLADGWIGAGASSAGDLTEQIRLLEAALRSEGRDPASFPRAKRVYIGVDDDAARAERDLAEALDGLYGVPGLAQRTGVFGTPEHCADALRGLVDAGANELILTPVYRHLEQLEALARLRDGAL